MHHLFHDEGGWVSPETRDDSDGAGGTLADVLAQHLRDGGGPRLAGQSLIYPAADVAGESPSRKAALPARPAGHRQQRCLVRHFAARVGGRTAVLPARTKQPEGEKELVARVLQAAAGQ